MAVRRLTYPRAKVRTGDGVSGAPRRQLSLAAPGSPRQVRFYTGDCRLCYNPNEKRSNPIGDIARAWCPDWTAIATWTRGSVDDDLFPFL
jgi:hypothetical protein